ncbi:unnamed protein product, partial [Brenthis ino]
MADTVGLQGKRSVGVSLPLSLSSAAGCGVAHFSGGEGARGRSTWGGWPSSVLAEETVRGGQTSQPLTLGRALTGTRRRGHGRIFLVPVAPALRRRRFFVRFFSGQAAARSPSLRGRSPT